MALPELTLPASLPCFLASGHAIEVWPVHAYVPRATGLTRTRRRFRDAPRVQTVSMLLDEDEAAEFRDWFERDLIAGSRHFSARVMNESGVALWWDAVWSEPPVYVAMPRGFWRVSGRLVLGIETPTVDGPVRGSMRAEIRAPLTGDASIEVGKPFAAEVVAALLGEVTAPELRLLAAEVAAPLLGEVVEATPRNMEAEILAAIT